MDQVGRTSAGRGRFQASPGVVVGRGCGAFAWAACATPKGTAATSKEPAMTPNEAARNARRHLALILGISLTPYKKSAGRQPPPPCGMRGIGALLADQGSRARTVVRGASQPDCVP